MHLDTPEGISDSEKQALDDKLNAMVEHALPYITDGRTQVLWDPL